MNEIKIDGQFSPDQIELYSEPVEALTLKVPPLDWIGDTADSVFGKITVYINAHCEGNPLYKFLLGSRMDIGFFSSFQKAQQAAEERYRTLLLNYFDKLPI